MKKRILAALFAVLFCAVPFSHAQEGGWHGDMRSRIHAEYQRIEQGIQRGALTRHEARMLKGELNGILDKIDRMERDGHLNHQERETIDRDLDRLHRDISREKSNDMRRRY
jgi:hypothetical protein